MSSGYCPCCGTPVSSDSGGLSSKVRDYAESKVIDAVLPKPAEFAVDVLGFVFGGDGSPEPAEGEGCAYCSASDTYYDESELNTGPVDRYDRVDDPGGNDLQYGWGSEGREERAYNAENGEYE